LGDEDLLLHLDNGIFYEFIPAAEAGSSNPRTVLLNEVEAGKAYALVISTNGGLWRYVVGDTIRFTSVRPYKIQVTGRIKHFINAFGEEVIVDNTDRALAQACQATGAAVIDYHVAPVYLTTSDKGGHQWAVEFSVLPKDVKEFALLLDEALRRINSDYDAKRQHNLALLPLQIVALPAGTFYSYLKQKGKLGGQHKVPRLGNDRLIMEEILTLIQN
jgi:hypothetical protein